MLASETETTIEVNFSPLTRRYTLEEFWALPERDDHARYDLIGGCLFLIPLPPEPPHGHLVSRTSRLLILFFTARNIKGYLYFPREPLYQRENATYFEPDMFYISESFPARSGPHYSSADIVFEVLMHGTSVYDRTIKADTYLALGVRELWLIDPFTATIEVRRADKIGEILVWKAVKYSRGQDAKSRVLEGFQVSVSDLFAELPLQD